MQHEVKRNARGASMMRPLLADYPDDSQARRGTFPGMLARRRFRIVKVAPGRDVGEGFTVEPDAVGAYDGREKQFRL